MHNTFAVDRCKVLRIVGIDSGVDRLQGKVKLMLLHMWKSPYIGDSVHLLRLGLR